LAPFEFSLAGLRKLILREEIGMMKMKDDDDDDDDDES